MYIHMYDLVAVVAVVRTCEAISIPGKHQNNNSYEATELKPLPINMKKRKKKKRPKCCVPILIVVIATTA